MNPPTNEPIDCLVINIPCARILVVHTAINPLTLLPSPFQPTIIKIWANLGFPNSWTSSGTYSLWGRIWGPFANSGWIMLIWTVKFRCWSIRIWLGLVVDGFNLYMYLPIPIYLWVQVWLCQFVWGRIIVVAVRRRLSSILSPVLREKEREEPTWFHIIRSTNLINWFGWFD